MNVEQAETHQAAMLTVLHAVAEDENAPTEHRLSAAKIVLEHAQHAIVMEQHRQLAEAMRGQPPMFPPPATGG